MKSKTSKNGLSADDLQDVKYGRTGSQSSKEFEPQTQSMPKEKFSITNRLKSFKYAFAGLKSLLADEHNARIHLAAALLVIIAGLILEISQTEWFVVLILIAFVFVAELFNTSIENLCDTVIPEQNEGIKRTKDQAAAAVLIAALAASLIGLWIFVPKLYALIF